MGKEGVFKNKITKNIEISIDVLGITEMKVHNPNSI